MNMKDIRQLPTDELHVEIRKSREKLFRMRFQAKGRDMENPGQMIVLKRSVARMLTVVRQREIAQARGSAATE